MNQFRVLLVDDEERILGFLTAKLKASGYEVITARDGIEALEQLQGHEPDLVVLDLSMPGKNGFDTLRELRCFSAIPVIILSARGGDTDKIRGLSLGADDYLAKPFNPEELVARIEAVRRRLESPEKRRAGELLTLGDVTINFEKRCVSVRGEIKPLPRLEWLLFSELARNAGCLMLYSELLTRVWGPEYRSDVHILRTWISRLRNKLEDDPGKPTLIRTVPKTGYTIEHPAA